MKIAFQKSGVVFLFVFSLSGAALASHPLDTAVEVDKDNLIGVRLEQISLRHAADGRYLLHGKVRRQLGFLVPFGHIDLFINNEQGQATFQDAEYYWPQIVNRRYRYPSEFVFIVPENLINKGALKVSYHKNTVGKKPKPIHW